MHNLSASFILAFHGCEREVGEKLLRNEPFEPSANDYDWLGPGIYFWEANPDRALDWAREQLKRLEKKDGRTREPFVIGAVLDLGFCLDLISSNGLRAVEDAYLDLQIIVSGAKKAMPVNAGDEDSIFRRLDCAVIEYLHKTRELNNQPAFDTVRGVFTEGEHIYPGSGFRRKTHIQVCVINPEAIKGVFRVAEKHFTER